MLTITAILMAIGLSGTGDKSSSRSFPALVISCLLVFVADVLCIVDLYFVLKK
jgi:hypothetical protein